MHASYMWYFKVCERPNYSNNCSVLKFTIDVYIDK